jgi:hypothetical protein
MTTADVALIVSGLALLVSIASLWINSLAPFNPKLSHDAPTFRLYKITPNMSGNEKGETWWIPSFDIGVSFYNTGKVPGEISDIRIVGELAGHRTTRKFNFYPKWIVNYTSFKEHGSDRFAWIATSVLRDWYPFMLGGHDQKDLHIVLESDRWDHKESGELKLVFEVISSKSKKWITYANYSLHISEGMFEDKSSFSPYDEKIEKLRKMQG